MGGRIAKNDVKHLISTIIQGAKNAKGGDAIFSRADRKAFLDGFESPALRSIAANVLAYADHRDAKKGARVTDPDLKKAEDFYHGIVDGIDDNKDGISKEEAAKGTTSQAIKDAVEYVRAQRGAKAPEQTPEN